MRIVASAIMFVIVTASGAFAQTAEPSEKPTRQTAKIFSDAGVFPTSVIAAAKVADFVQTKMGGLITKLNVAQGELTEALKEEDLTSRRLLRVIGDASAAHTAVVLNNTELTKADIEVMKAYDVWENRQSEDVRRVAIMVYLKWISGSGSGYYMRTPEEYALMNVATSKLTELLSKERAEADKVQDELFNQLISPPR